METKHTPSEEVKSPAQLLSEAITDSNIVIPEKYDRAILSALSAAISQAVRVTKERVEKYGGYHLRSCEKVTYSKDGATCTCGFLSLESEIIKELSQ